jgi:hypothetical protein
LGSLVVRNVAEGTVENRHDGRANCYADRKTKTRVGKLGISKADEPDLVAS